MPAKSLASLRTSSSGTPAKRPRTGDACADALDSLQISALADLTKVLQAEPHTILPTLHWVNTTGFDRMEKATPEDGFHSTYCKLYRLPKDFLREYLPDLVGDRAKVSSDTVVNLEKGEAGVSRKIFFYGTHTSTDTAWPQHCHMKSTFRSVFMKAHEHHGKRLSAIEVYMDGQVKRVDWKKWGSYILVPLDQPQKTHVLYVASGVKAPLDDLVTNYDVRENWHDMKAQIKIKRSWTDFTDYFEKDFKDTRVNLYRDNKALLQGFATTFFSALPPSTTTPTEKKSSPAPMDAEPEGGDDSSDAPPEGEPAAACRQVGTT